MKEERPRYLNPRKFWNIIIPEKDILSWFDECDAAWIHSGDPKMPHAELTSGLCSNGFFDCRRVLKYPNVCEILADQLASKIRMLEGINPGQVDWVIGSPYSGITFSYEVARTLKARHGFCEKDLKDPKKMVWKGETIDENAKVLQAEELITTSGTFKEIRRAVLEAHQKPPQFYSFIAALIHRPPKIVDDYDGLRVVGLIEKEIWAVEQSQCHLCMGGSKRVRPRANWKELTGK